MRSLHLEHLAAQTHLQKSKHHCVDAQHYQRNKLRLALVGIANWHLVKVEINQ